ncbi:hypothetical protein, partial [Aquitalea magnusonii]|uniref:hypothetical protein n=1 Tax=Aquitalea magnusonii TaxID=332411 RepID=UPI001957C93E
PPPALPGGLSISLDSLPDGVLGGGVGKVEEARPLPPNCCARASTGGGDAQLRWMMYCTRPN